MILLLAALISGQVWPAPAIINAPGINGAARFTQDASGVTIGPVAITGAYRAVETDAGVDTPDLHIKGLTATGLTRDGIRLRNAPNLLIEDFELRHSDTASSGSDLPEGIAVYAGGGIIRRGMVSGFKMIPGSGYINGDGIATEGGVDGLAIEDVVSSDNSDGGFDLKGRVSLDRVTSARNSRNYRFWHNITAGTITSIDPRSGHIWVGKGSVIHIAKLIVRSVTTAPILILDGGSITIDECDIQVPVGTPWSRTESSGNKLTMGTGCRL